VPVPAAPAQQQNTGQQQPQHQDTPANTPTPAPAAPAQVEAPNPQSPIPNPAAPSPQAAPVTAPAQTAAAQAPAPAPAAPVPGARLAQAVETVHQVIRISQSGGITQARVQLHPEELGQINIHLRSTPDGVVARVMADASQAAAVLRDGGDELRRQLASQGINLTHLDVGTTGQEQREATFGNGGQQQRGTRGNSSEDPTPDTQDPTTADETTIALPNGVLVDVLA
jgi:flagellar hook-length control protein FliK